MKQAYSKEIKTYPIQVNGATRTLSVRRLVTWDGNKVIECLSEEIDGGVPKVRFNRELPSDFRYDASEFEPYLED